MNIPAFKSMPNGCVCWKVAVVRVSQGPQSHCSVEKLLGFRFVRTVRRRFSFKRSRNHEIHTIDQSTEDILFQNAHTSKGQETRTQPKMAPNRSDENPLTALVIDVSPVAWGDRDLRRTASNRKRQSGGKPSNGQPLILEELLSSVQAFASALVSLERESALLIIAVAGNEVAVVHPRKDHLETFFSNTEMKQDTRKIQSDLIQGVSELVARAAKHIADPSHTIAASQAAMASAFSLSLCLINRFLVATNAGVSALNTGPAWNRGNADDEGVVAAIGGGGKKKSARKTRAWAPRVLMIQASDDRPGDYNAIMNCAFASVKHQIIVDGCFLRCDHTNKSSALLEQTCDLTGGLFLVRSPHFLVVRMSIVCFQLSFTYLFLYVCHEAAQWSRTSQQGSY